MGNKTITINIDKEALKLIDKASKEEFCSRSNFLVRHSLRSAKEILNQNNKIAEV